jgi:hypothetical protein
LRLAIPPTVFQTASMRLAVLGLKGKIAGDALDTIADAVLGMDR